MTGRLYSGCFDSGRLDSGRLDSGQLYDWTLGLWTLGLYYWTRGLNEIFSIFSDIYFFLLITYCRDFKHLESSTTDFSHWLWLCWMYCKYLLQFEPVYILILYLYDTSNSLARKQLSLKCNFSWKGVQTIQPEMIQINGIFSQIHPGHPHENISYFQIYF